MKVYKSKVDSWLMAIVVGILILPIALSLFFKEGFWITSLICGIALAFVVWLYLATCYKISEAGLKIHGGLFKIDIPLADIQSVKNSRNPLSSPAFSLDRLEITYGKDKRRVLISPKRKRQFLSDIGWLEELIPADR